MWVGGCLGRSFGLRDGVKSTEYKMLQDDTQMVKDV